MRKNQDLFKIFLVILFDIISFGIVIPLTPILAREFGATGMHVGLIISAYSVIQFFITPIWGRLSDIFGRKPIILIGLIGSSLAHLLFAFSDSFLNICISRLLAGFFGANIAISTAYIADITSLKNRTKNLGLVGMAFGFGFTIGPMLGFLLIILGEKLGNTAPLGVHLASVGSSVFCLINACACLFFLKESLTIKPAISKSLSFLPRFQDVFHASSLFKRPSLKFVWKSLKTPRLGLILFMTFILFLSLAQIEPVLTLLVQDKFEWSKKLAYGSFIYIGVLMIFSQAVLIKSFLPKWGESLLIQRSLFCMACGLAIIGLSCYFVHSQIDIYFVALILLFLGVTFFSIGYSLANTSLNGALSLMTSQQHQGSIFGINQSCSSMARILGPIAGGWLYHYISYDSPFFMASILTASIWILSIKFKTWIPNISLKQSNKKETS